MKNLKRAGFLLTLAALIAMVSCKKENIDTTAKVILFDCDSIESNIGDPCEYYIDSVLFAGVVNPNCQCTIEEDDTYCDEVIGANANYPNGYIGGECWTIDDVPGTINENCECIADSVVYDCVELELNFEDDCSTQEIQEGIVNEDCECVEWSSQFDCPDLFANIGDSCYVDINVVGVVNPNCQCVE